MLKSNISFLKCGCSLHTSSKLHAKPAKVMQKIMGQNKKKKYYVQPPLLPSISMSFGKPIEVKITGNLRRGNMLNKLFMRHITDIMSSGQYSNELLGHGIEVNKVKVTPDYKILNVYWVTKESKKQDEIAQLLKKNAGYISHELASVMLMGKVPTIQFVKDVQDCLSKADFGEDFEPTDIAENFKSEVDIVMTSLTNDVKAKLQIIDRPIETDSTSDDLPTMAQNVLGLDHADILKRIRKGMTTSKAFHRTTNEEEWTQWSQFKSTQSNNKNPVNFNSVQERRKAFKTFLRQRQILQAKQYKLDKKWTPDREYLEEECFERRRHWLEMESEIEYEDFTTEDTEKFKDEVKSENS
ncbi:putative ribosome-binding factor A, mitochondrial isoform X2 [Euwallacea fornicatus]|uniref:putative ribosome-binding factor A, mitochondrial isoform X2 n=1 Tax=Euwallacea fornicatus TaxID=995702 RepID=UPI00338FE097